MKNTRALLVIVAICVTTSLFAQEKEKKSLFIVSPGAAIFNNGEQGGVSFSNDYVRNIQKHITFGIKIFFANGEGNVKGLPPQNDIHISTSALDFSAMYQPFMSEKHILLIGLGITADFTRTSYLSNTDYITLDNKIYTIADTDGTISILIPVYSIHYYYNIKRNMLIGFNVNCRDLRPYQYIIGVSGGVVF